MTYEWIDLPNKKNCFTVRNAAMRNLDTKETVRHYLANTKIVVVQKCTIDGTTFYRTADAVYRNLNHAFEAAAFGLPNEVAPSVPISPAPKVSRAFTLLSFKKQKPKEKPSCSNDGGSKRCGGLLRRFYRRKNG